MSDSRHSPIGASSAHRWMTCPGSVRQSQGLPNDSSPYALEGSAAHQVAERCLRQGLAAEEFIGQEITVLQTTFTVDEEMAAGVQVYLDAILADHRTGDVMAVEERFDLSAFFPGLFGTNDCSLYHPASGELVVYDLKFGRGVAVNVAANPQLLYYGLGAAIAVPGRKLSAVELVVVQPRCPHPEGAVRRWRTDALSLLEWSAELVAAAQATVRPDAPLQAGTHCKFCPAAPLCPALHAHALATAQAEFGPGEERLPVAPETLSGEALARVLHQADVIEEWLRRVREFAHREAEAGRTPPGFKLVPKRGQRDWRDDEQAAAFLQGMGLDEADILKPKEIKSPAQIETTLGKRKLDKKTISPLVISRSSGTTLVAITDARREVPPAAIRDFQTAASSIP